MRIDRKEEEEKKWTLEMIEKLALKKWVKLAQKSAQIQLKIGLEIAIFSCYEVSSNQLSGTFCLSQAKKTVTIK